MKNIYHWIACISAYFTAPFILLLIAIVGQLIAKCILYTKDIIYTTDSLIEDVSLTTLESSLVDYQVMVTLTILCLAFLTFKYMDILRKEVYSLCLWRLFLYHSMMGVSFFAIYIFNSLCLWKMVDQTSILLWLFWFIIIFMAQLYVYQDKITFVKTFLDMFRK